VGKLEVCFVGGGGCFSGVDFVYVFCDYNYFGDLVGWVVDWCVGHGGDEDVFVRVLEG